VVGWGPTVPHRKKETARYQMLHKGLGLGDIIHTILVEKPEGKNYLEDLGVDGRIILNWTLGK
jgi:hypothetical protein